MRAFLGETETAAAPNKRGTRRTWPRRASSSKAGSLTAAVIALLVCSGLLFAANAAGVPDGAAVVQDAKTEPPKVSTAPQPERPPAPSMTVTFADGRLTINARNSNLGEILAKVSTLLGMKLDLPGGVNGERVPFVAIGPGPARDVMAELLSETKFDYLIQASESNPEKIDNLLLMLRDAKSAKSPETMAASLSPGYPRHAPPPEPEPPSPAPEVAANVTVAPVATPEAAPSPAPPADSAAQSATTPPPTDTRSTLQPAQTGGSRPGALSPPGVMTQESMSQQLQQMYQQRALINQQERQAAQAPPK